MLKITLERYCFLAIFHHKQQCPITAVVRRNDQFLDSVYHRRLQPEPDIKSGLQGPLLIPLSSPQILITNDLVCAQQHCLSFSLSNIGQKSRADCIIPARMFIFEGTIRYAPRMTYPALERPQNQYSLPLSCPFDFLVCRWAYDSEFVRYLIEKTEEYKQYCWAQTRPFAFKVWRR